ncbi:carbonate dehydratase [Candidatus Macondimonas diazotrophica]|jgi:carbonic anhydrase|uniref:Carbonic anhydrase n=1 Tax=Candidatus Macondimonas diazotrophica TaxID=2305248 RepID=A0A4Z0F8E3_9GAMM|nr:carbonate dehydratase [Candidatus Macondimonas diazotrophica]NCU02194.1 carbonate dehydratase [Candidatus Macondimonas diazotrophica]TFZ81541.1 carbonate dehydratase [Candidatus Macondimonas diazotrophica]
MSNVSRLFKNNQAWSADIVAHDPAFFESLSQIQTPEFLWIGCSDSRVPANEITGLKPGEVFVHRNVANVVAHGDLNCLAVVQFAVDVLKVRDVLIVGHYGCGGVKAALEDLRLGLVDNWLRHIHDVKLKHSDLLMSIPDEKARFDRLCELNAIEQARHLCQTTVIQDAWAREQPLTVHSWIYGLTDGIIHDLGYSVSDPEAVDARYESVIRGGI